MIRIGTRGSALAQAQAREIKRRLKKLNPSLSFCLSIIKTAGDEYQGVALFKKNNVGVFTKAIEKKLMQGKIDLAVHSLKDLPTDLPRALRLAAIPKRLDTRDVLISRHGFNIKTLPRGARVGTGSPRRKSQLKKLRPDLEVVDLRGNLDTRVRQVLVEKKLDAIVLARAGLLRIKKFHRVARDIAPDEMLPAPGQGALGIEIRRNDARLFGIVKKLNHPGTEKRVAAERALLKALQGGCRVPIGIDSAMRGNKIFLKAAVFSVGSGGFVSAQGSWPQHRYLAAGRALARLLLKKGAAKFLNEARRERISR